MDHNARMFKALNHHARILQVLNPIITQDKFGDPRHVLVIPTSVVDREALCDPTQRSGKKLLAPSVLPKPNIWSVRSGQCPHLVCLAILISYSKFSLVLID